MDIHTVSLLSICTGIGGLDLGVSMAVPGARTVCMVEGEAACVEVLASRMEDGWLHPAPIWTDARTFDGRPWRGRVHGIVAGYPCQPFSLAGKRQGTGDPRHLWPEILRIAGEVGPEFLFLENVAGHIRLGLDQVLSDLTQVGFDAEWETVRASDVGAPHRRERVFILAYARSRGLESLRRCWVQHNERATPRHNLDRCRPSLGWPPGPRGDWSRVPEHLYPATQRRLRGVADGVPGRLDRLRALGNAVVPQQAALALRQLASRIER